MIAQQAQASPYVVTGTDDDLPDHGPIRTSKHVHFSGAMRIISRPVSRGTELPDMEFQIHCIETEAYGAVLRAFIAQSDVLSWDKEKLITELRKELRVSDLEHREILGKINSDDSINSIRELRKSTDVQQMTMMNPPASDLSSVGHMSRKRLKPAHSTVLSSPKYPPYAQPSPVAVPPSATLIRDDQWGSNAAVFSPQMNVGQTMIPVPQNRQAPSSGKVRGPPIVQTSKKGFVHSGFENIKPGSDIIEIHATDKLIQEVEKACGGVNPDPAQVEKAKLILREHEGALLEAIGKLADVSDDDSPDQRQHLYSNEERRRNAHGFYNASYGQFDRSRSYQSEGYITDHTERAGIPCINLQEDEYDRD